MHGWAIAQRIRQMSDDVLQVGQSALYPALHKLERQGWVTSEWRTSETNRRARYYSLTEAGRDAVVDEAARWERLSAAILQDRARYLKEKQMSRWFHGMRVVLRSIVHPRREEDEPRRGIPVHLDRMIDAGIEAGLTPEEARRAARRAMGPVDVQAGGRYRVDVDATAVRGRLAAGAD